MADEELQAGERVRALYIEAGDPDIALLDRWLAGRLDVAKRFDRGEIADAEVEAEMSAAAEAANEAFRHQQIGLQAARILGERAPAHIAGEIYG